MTCPTCSGHGKLLDPEEDCPRCLGDGEIASRPEEHEEFEPEPIDPRLQCRASPVGPTQGRKHRGDALPGSAARTTRETTA